MKNKGITLVALVITIIILLILAGITISTLGGENGLFAKVNQAKKMQMKAQMKETLILAIQELQLDKSGKATLDDITQEWIESTITEYTCTITEDASIEGKRITMQKDNEKGKFIIDKNLKVIEVESNDIEFTYEVKSREGNNVNIVITIEDNQNEIKEIIVPNGNKITTNGENEIQIDYTVELGKEYKFTIVTEDGNEREESILISDYYYNITKELSPEVSIDNVSIKAAYNKAYEANITVADGYIIDSLSVTMGNQVIDVDTTTGKIYIEKVTDEIKITITAKKIEIEVSEIIIGTSTTATTSVADYSQANGTTLYINFSAELEGTACTISPSVPYAITTFGTYKFTATGTYGGKEITKDIEVVVNKYQVYEIRTPDDFQNIKNNLAGIYYVMNDIDMSGYSFTIIGGTFTGVLDGQGHTISNLTIENQNGIFVAVKSAIIKNILFKDVDINHSDYVGGIAGWSYGNNKIENVGITGEISGYIVGSFMAYMTGSGDTFINCYARTVLTSSSEYDCGGFVVERFAGIALTNCYWSGTMTAEKRIGPFKGNMSNDNNSTEYAPILTNCYYNKSLFSIYDLPAVTGTGLETADFANSANFEGWDFENTWVIKDGYPELRIFLKDGQ